MYICISKYVYYYHDMNASFDFNIFQPFLPPRFPSPADSTSHNANLSRTKENHEVWPR